MNEKESDIKITHLKCREIQAPIVSSLVKGFAQEIGYEKANEIIKKTVQLAIKTKTVILSNKCNKSVPLFPR